MEIALFAGAAFLFSQISLLFFLMAVPLILLGKRQGLRALLIAGGFLLVVLLVQIYFRVGTIEEPVLRRFFFMMKFAYPLTMIAGVWILFWARGRTLFRILTASGFVLLISLPIAGYYTGNQEVMEFLKEQLQILLGNIQAGLNSNAAGETEILLSSLESEELYELVSKIFTRNYLVSYFLVISFSWYVAEGFYHGIHGGQNFLISSFRLGESFLWPFLITWAGVLLDVTVGVPYLGFLFWNYGVILLLIYALQGIGIMKFLFGRYGVSRLIQTLTLFSAVLVMMTPRLNLVLIIGVPLLGISEYWVRYRTPVQQ